MELSKDDIAFIKGLSQKMKTQDNRGTAQPYALIIGEKITRVQTHNTRIKLPYFGMKPTTIR